MTHGGAPSGRTQMTVAMTRPDQGGSVEHVESPAAGWYAAPHANGEQRYWNGSAWGEPQQQAKPVSLMKRTMTRRTGAIVAGSALVLGLVIGGASSGASTNTQLSGLKAQVSALQADVVEAQATVETSASDLATATAAGDALTRERDSAKARVVELEAAATAAKTELDARAATIADLQGKVTTQNAAPPAAEITAPEASSQSAYYKNCTAAREAGAAPVRRGDPGYGSHLDRDGDGVGCE